MIEIPLHFDVDKNYLPINEFVEIVQSTRIIIDNLNLAIYGGELQYEVLILPPVAGSFLQRIGFLICTAWIISEGNNGAAYIKGLTGHEPAYWFEKAGEATANVKLSETFIANHNAQIIAECTKGFLKKSNDELEKAKISKQEFRDAYEARNHFYMSCINNPDVNGVGFDESENFPIKRSDFPRFVVDLPPVKEEPIASWKVETKEVKVTSPNWARDLRQWKGIYGKNRVVWFTIEDETFWHAVGHKGLKPRIFDTLKVQWAFPADSARRANVRVLRVLQYNGKKISTALSGDELREVLEDYSFIYPAQQELFPD